MAKAKATDKSGPWLVNVGINYPPNDKRAEPGEVIDDLPAVCVAWMLRDGIIEPAPTGHAPNSED